MSTDAESPLKKRRLDEKALSAANNSSGSQNNVPQEEDPPRNGGNDAGASPLAVAPADADLAAAAKKPSSSSSQKPTNKKQQQQPSPSPNRVPISPSLSAMLERQDNPIYRLVLTGGPCAGKSTALTQIATTVAERTNYRVFCVPEAATLLVKGGLRWDNMTNERVIEYQLALLRTQIALEDSFTAIARACGQPALIVCDRGTMDGRAYATEEQFAKILERGNWTIEQLRDERYDAVIHLVTAAIGAESAYNLDNPARFETVEMAQSADRHLRKMYVGHPRLKLIDNLKDQSFQTKIEKCVDYAFEVIGARVPKHRTHRFRIAKPPKPEEIPVPFVTLKVVCTILSGSSPSDVRLLLSRRQGASQVNILQYTTQDEDGTKSVRRDTLSIREYSHMLQQRDPKHIDVVKQNYSFTHNDLFFDLAVFEQPERLKGEAVLYVEGLLDPNNLCEKFPSWLRVDGDTTADSTQSTYSISKIDGDC